MIFRAGVLTHGARPIFLAQELILGTRGQRRVVQSHIILSHGTGIGERQRDLDALDEHRDVHGITQVIAPDYRLRERIIASET